MTVSVLWGAAQISPTPGQKGRTGISRAPDDERKNNPLPLWPGASRRNVQSAGLIIQTVWA
jgi:hypothetical protein